MKILAPSLLSADFSKLKEEVTIVENAGAQYLHLDVMDGQFVPNISFGAPVIQCLRPHSNMVFDVHLMICEPIRYLEDFAKAGADILNVHAEACTDLGETIKKIKELGKKVGITIKPDTPVSAIEPYLAQVDMVLVMTVYSGFSGQKLIPQALEKIKTVLSLRESKGLSFLVQIDGGVGLSNLKEVLQTGVDIIVAGSAVFGAKDPSQACQAFFDVFHEMDS